MEKDYFLTRYPKRKNFISLINDEAKNYIEEYLLSLNSNNNKKIDVQNLNKTNFILNLYDSKGNLLKKINIKNFPKLKTFHKFCLII